MVSKVYMICNSYESGYGHGLANDGLDLSKTPHADPELGEAYQIGYEAGRRAGQSSEKCRNLTAEVDNLYRYFPSMKTPNVGVTGLAPRKDNK